MTLATPTMLAHAHLDAGAAVTVSVDAAQALGLYVLDGTITDDNGSMFGPGTLVVLTSGDRVGITATPEQPVDVALLGGMSVEGPILFSGPFVMDTAERLAQTKRDFASGKMGTLDGVPF